MFQYVKVCFDESRDVLVDGARCGKTNEIVRVAAGTHEFALEGPQNFTPLSIVEKVVGTTVIRPMQIEFALNAVDLT